MSAAVHVGLTGGIGSGKSTVAAMLAELGACVVDTDGIARALTLPGGAGIVPIREVFGPAYIDATGALDRAAMRQRVFTDPAAKAQLEGLLHPLIHQQAQHAAAQVAPEQTVVFDVPLLVESIARWRPLVDVVLVVDCPPDRQVARVMQRSGWTAAEVERVIAQQAPRAARQAVADVLIDNGAVSLEALREQVLTFWQTRHRWAGRAHP